jgi:hypothetical protein
MTRNDVVVFRAKLADGRVIVGPIQGRGGKLGNSSLYQGIEKARIVAERALLNMQSWWEYSGKESPGYFYPDPGCVAIYPDYSSESDGQYVVIPLLGTRFEIER